MKEKIPSVINGNWETIQKLGSRKITPCWRSGAAEGAAVESVSTFQGPECREWSVRTGSLAGHFQFFQHVTGIFILRIEIE